MRTKVKVVIVGFGAVFISLVFLLSRQKDPQVNNHENTEVASKESSAVSPKLFSGTKNGSPSNAIPKPPSLSVTNQEAIDARVNRLMEISASGDKAHLKEILAELNNPIPDIRKAARESAVVFGDKSAVNVLEDQMALTEDVEERKALSDAIEFLNLPTLSETLAMMATNGNSKPREVVQDGQKFQNQISRETKLLLLEQERAKQKQQQAPSTRPETPPRNTPANP